MSALDSSPANQPPPDQPQNPDSSGRPTDRPDHGAGQPADRPDDDGDKPGSGNGSGDKGNGFGRQYMSTMDLNNLSPTGSAKDPDTPYSGQPDRKGNPKDGAHGGGGGGGGGGSGGGGDSGHSAPKKDAPAPQPAGGGGGGAPDTDGADPSDAGGAGAPDSGPPSGTPADTGGGDTIAPPDATYVGSATSDAESTTPDDQSADAPAPADQPATTPTVDNSGQNPVAPNDTPTDTPNVPPPDHPANFQQAADVDPIVPPGQTVADAIGPAPMADTVGTSAPDLSRGQELLASLAEPAQPGMPYGTAVPDTEPSPRPAVDQSPDTQPPARATPDTDSPKATPTGRSDSPDRPAAPEPPPGPARPGVAHLFLAASIPVAPATPTPAAHSGFAVAYVAGPNQAQPPTADVDVIDKNLKANGWAQGVPRDSRPAQDAAGLKPGEVRVELDPRRGRESMRDLLPPPRTEFEDRAQRQGMDRIKGPDGGIIGYGRMSDGVYQVYDVNGKGTTVAEKPIESEDSPLDYLPFEIVGSLVKAAGEAGLRQLGKIAAREVGEAELKGAVKAGTHAVEHKAAEVLERGAAKEAGAARGATEIPQAGTKEFDEHVDHAFVGPFKGGDAVHYKPTRSLGVRPDVAGAEAAGQHLTAEAGRKALNVLGKPLNGNPAVLKAWQDASKTVLAKHGGSSVAEITKGMSHDEAKKFVNGKVYNATRQEFWTNVEKSPQAKQFFKENGFDFKGGKGTAPLHESHLNQGSKFLDEYRISLDHMAPKDQGENWQRALDPNNLQFVSHAENRFLNTMDVKGIRR
jgi:hypothetical protein